jgi:hypothetical protein
MAPLTILDLPPEIHIQIVQKLDPFSSTCFGLSNSCFYPLHRSVHGSVVLKDTFCPDCGYEKPGDLSSWDSECQHYHNPDFRLSRVLGSGILSGYQYCIQCRTGLPKHCFGNTFMGRFVATGAQEKWIDKIPWFNVRYSPSSH